MLGPADRQAAGDGLAKEQVIRAAGEAHALLEAELRPAQERGRDHHIVGRRDGESRAVGEPAPLEYAAPDEPARRLGGIHRLHRAVQAVRIGFTRKLQECVQPSLARPLVVVDEAEEVRINRSGRERRVARDRDALPRLMHVHHAEAGRGGKCRNRRLRRSLRVVVDDDRREAERPFGRALLAAQRGQQMLHAVRPPEGDDRNGDVDRVGRRTRVA